MNQRLFFAFFLLLTTSLLLACRQTPAPTPTATVPPTAAVITPNPTDVPTTAVSPTSDTGPAEAAAQWLTAVLTQDGLGIAQHSCNTMDQQPGSPAVLTIWAIGIAAKASDQDALTFPQSFTYELVRHDNQTADVHVTGSITIPDAIRQNQEIVTLPDADAYQLDDTWHFIQSTDSWRWCGVTQN